MTYSKTTKRKKPEEREKDELIGMLAKEFEKAPEDMWALYPAVAARVEKLVSAKRPASDSEGLHYFYLGERETEFRLNALAAIVEKWKVATVSR